MQKLTPTSRSKLESFAEAADSDDEEAAEDQQRDVQVSASACASNASKVASELINRLAEEASHQTDGDAEDEENEEDGGEVMQVLHEMMEEYEENSSLPQGELANDEGLVARLAAHQSYDGNIDGDVEADAENDDWVQEQVGETLERERGKIEEKLTAQVLSSGATIQGSALLEIAEGCIADLWPEFVFWARVFRDFL